MVRGVVERGERDSLMESDLAGFSFSFEFPERRLLTVTASLCPLSPRSHFTPASPAPSSLDNTGVSNCHTPITLSLPPVNRYFPSSLAARHSTAPAWPCTAALPSLTVAPPLALPAFPPCLPFPPFLPTFVTLCPNGVPTIFRSPNEYRASAPSLLAVNKSVDEA